MSVVSGRVPERALIFAVAGALALLASPAAACTLRLGPLQTTPVAYDPFAEAADGMVRVEVSLAEGAECEGVLRLEDQGGSALRSVRFGDGPEYAVELMRSPGVEPSVDPASAAVRLSGTDARLAVEWRIRPGNGDIIRAGDYAFPLQVSAAGPGFDAAGPSAGTLFLRSIARAQVNVAGTAGGYAGGRDAFTIDLGELVTGRTGRAFLQVRANTPSRIGLESTHHGFLVNQTLPSARVPYAISLDSHPLDLSARTAVPVTAPLTRDGLSLPLVVTVGEVHGALAGRYSDTIIIDISP